MNYKMFISSSMILLASCAFAMQENGNSTRQNNSVQQSAYRVIIPYVYLSYKLSPKILNLYETYKTDLQKRFDAQKNSTTKNIK